MLSGHVRLRFRPTKEWLVPHILELAEYTTEAVLVISHKLREVLRFRAE